MTTDNERRRSPRIPCHDVWLQIRVCDPSSSAPAADSLPPRQARVDNLSDTGICLISATPFELGQVVFFFDPNLPGQGTVVWTCQAKGECKVGIQFVT
jgi:hypothetical protein